MKYLGTIITSLAMAVAPAVADFNIYYTQKRPGFTNGYSFYDGEPSADAVLHSTIWYTSDSVWDVEGIRCNGGGCLNSEDLSNIDVLEFNTHNWSPKLHFTIYRDRDWKMFGVDGNEYGKCEVDTSHKYAHVLNDYRGSEALGWRVFSCKSIVTADELNAYRNEDSAYWIDDLRPRPTGRRTGAGRV